MKKAQLPLIAELDLGDTEHPTVKLACKFIGTDNPRHLRVIRALMIRPRTREGIDRIAGASNGPELIAELRRRGLAVQCQRGEGSDRDGRAVQFGIYSLDEDDRRAVIDFLRLRNARGCRRVPQNFGAPSRGATL